MDPLKLGRLRVRALGFHTEDKTLIPTEDLFWAYPHTGLAWNKGINGLGMSPNGPVEGCWVYGYFKDSEACQDPQITQVLTGIPQLPDNPNEGFQDPGPPIHNLDTSPRKVRSRFYPNDGTGAQLVDESSGSNYPRSTHPWGAIVGEADTNRLARGELTDDTIIGVRNRQRDVHVPVAFAHTNPGRKWNEPESTYAAVYPYNNVFESESGHILEVDDTPKAERLQIYHRSGTYIEIQGGTDGDFVLKCVGKRFEVTMENAYSHFQNTMNVTVDGETNVYCRSNCNLQVDGDLNVHVGGDYTEKVQGNYYTDIGGNRVVRINGTDELDTGGSRITRIGSTDEENVVAEKITRVGGGEDLSVGGSRSQKVGGSTKESSGGAFTIASGSVVSADGTFVHLNSGFGTPSAPNGPAGPAGPNIPPFPAPLDQWIEDRNETGPDPSLEEKPDVTPITATVAFEGVTTDAGRADLGANVIDSGLTNPTNTP